MEIAALSYSCESRNLTWSGTVPGGKEDSCFRRSTLGENSDDF